jgi:GAF domain-containing protein
MLEDLVRVGIDLARERDIDTLSRRAVEHARRFTGAETSMLLLREQSHLRLAVAQRDEIEPSPVEAPSGSRATQADPIAIDPSSVLGYVALTGTSLNIPDLLTWDARKSFPMGGQDIRSVLAVPLSARTGEIIGVLAVTNARDSDGHVIPFNDAHENAVGFLATHTAAAINDARVFRQADQLLTLSRLPRAVTSSPDSRAACGAIVEVTTRLLGAVWTGVWVDDPIEHSVRVLATFAADPDIDASPANVAVLRYDEGLVGRIIESHNPEYVRDVVHDSRWVNRPLVSSSRVHGYAGVPLMAGNRIVGALSILFSEPREFGAEDRQFIEILADHAAIALDHVRSGEEAREQRHSTTALLAVAQALSSRISLAEMMERVGHEVAQALGADAVGTYLLDAQGEVLLPVAHYGLPTDLIEAFGGMSLVLENWPAIRDTMRNQRVIYSADAGGDSRCDREALASVPPHTLLFAPTVARGEAVGGIYALWWHTGRKISVPEIRLIEGVAMQVGVALENDDLVRQAEARLKETDTLLAVSRALASTLDVGELIRHFLRRIASVVEADGVGTYLLDHDGEWLVPLQGYRLPPDRLDALRALRLSIVQHPFYAEGARTRRPVYSADAMHDPRIPVAMRQAAEHRSELFVPIVAKGQVVGGLVAAWWNRVRELSERDLALIEMIATQAGVLLENVRLFQQNRRQVKELSVLHALSRAVTGEVDRRTLIEALYAQVALVFDTRELVIVLPGSREGEVVVALRIRNGRREAAAFERCAAEQAGLAAVVMRTGLPLRTDDQAAESARHGIGSSPGARAIQHWLGVPMTAADAVLGVVALASDERAFTGADERLLANIARLAALALRISRISEERETAYSELYLLSLITHRALRRWHEGADEPVR